MAQSGSILGNSVLRKEDPGLLTGANEYFDDLKVDGLAHIVFVRSHVAHGRLGAVDTTEAKAMPGVLAVLHRRRPEPARQRRLRRHARAQAPAARPGQGPLRRRHRGRRRRRDPYQAADAAEAVVVDYDPLPAVVDLEESLAGDDAAVRGQGHQRLLRHRRTAPTSTPSRAPTSWPRPASSASAWPACPWSPTAASPSPRATASRFYVSTQAPHAVHAGHGRRPGHRGRAASGSSPPGSAAASARRRRATSSTSSPPRPPGRSAGR